MKFTRTKELAQTLLEMTENVSPEEQAKALKDFVQYLARKQSLGDANAIMAEYQSLYNAKHGIVEVTVTAISRLSDTARHELVESLKKKYHAMDVRLTEKVDARVLGGMKIQVGDEVYDSSIQNSLSQLQEVLLNSYVN